MDDDVEILKRIYDCFNSGYIDGVLAVLADARKLRNHDKGDSIHQGHTLLLLRPGRLANDPSSFTAVAKCLAQRTLTVWRLSVG